MKNVHKQSPVAAVLACVYNVSFFLSFPRAFAEKCRETMCQLGLGLVGGSNGGGGGGTARCSAFVMVCLFCLCGHSSDPSVLVSSHEILKAKRERCCS